MAELSLKERIQSDMKNAMRARNQQLLDAIRFILSIIKQKEIDERITLDDAQVMAILEKLIKQRKDAIDQFKQANREDLIAKEMFELNLLQSYLPEPLSEEAVNELIQQAIQESGATSIRDMGKVMTILKPQIQGKADMGQISAIVKKLLP